MNIPHRLFVREVRSDRGETVHLEPEPRELVRACHLSGQMEADQAFAHYRDGELPITLEGPEPGRPLYRAIVAVLCAAVAIAVAALLAPGGLIFTK